MQTIGNRIKIARKRQGLTQEALAEMIGASQSMVSEWERNINDPMRHQIPKLARALNVTEGWLELGLTGALSGGELNLVHTAVVDAPIIDWVEAGRFAETVDPYPVGHAEGTVPVASRSKTLIALRVSGTSMDRVFPQGTIIIVDYSDKTLLDGKFYVFRVNGTATCKRWRSDPPRLEPFSHDASHESIFPKEAIDVVGRVIHSQLDHH